MWEDTAPGTEIHHIFCAGISLLQLGFVLVSSTISFFFFVIIGRYVHNDVYIWKPSDSAAMFQGEVEVSGWLNVVITSDYIYMCVFSCLDS